MWTKEKINLLKELFPNEYNKNLSNILGETLYSIKVKKNQLGLKKSKDFLTSISRLGNKKRIENGGRDLNFENLKTIALRYKTRIDFICGDGAAYNSARIKGYLDDICKHMTVMKFSIPQLILREITEQIFGIKCSYNNRKVLKPYEIDVYYEEFQLGFEYQGIAWHLNNKNDEIKKNLAELKNIKLIFLHETSRNYEQDIKEELISNIGLINHLSNKNITKEDILNIKIKNIYADLYNEEELINIAKKYTSFIKFKNEQLKVYRKLCKLNKIDLATNHMLDKKINKHNYSLEYIKNIIKKFDNLTDFRKEQLQVYKHVKRVKLDHLLDNIKRKLSYSEVDIVKRISHYTYKCDFIKENKQMYNVIRKSNFKLHLNKLIDCRKK
jgi:hypothetical protein